MGASPPALVADLVERFSRDRKVLVSRDYKEDQIRAEFLNPFFESLGWDASGRRSHDPNHHQMINGRRPFWSLL
jgi:hypothetical protein